MAEQVILNRVSFNNKSQATFLKEAIDKIGKPLYQISRICGVDKRTFYDWRTDKYQMTHTALKRLVKCANIQMPKSIEILPEYWYVKKGAKKGAIKRNLLYGNPGTKEGRRKGGLAAIAKFKKEVDYARKVGFKLRKEIRHPKKSSLLAEFIGIMLGDGSLNNNQAKITLNSKTDRDYVYFISKIINQLFVVKPSVAFRDKNTVEIMIYSRNIVDFLVECGLKLGDKVTNKIDVPGWILSKKCFIKKCLRGLIDTDGGLYFHNHITKGIRYINIGLCFTNNSLPLLISVKKMFLILGISAKGNNTKHVSIYGVSNIDKYMSIVGSSNIKNIDKLRLYKKQHTY